MKEKCISIIVPVYNVEKYIKQCLDSIVHQDYNNIEILVIDDGSEDKTGTICDEYALQDRRIKVVHKKNGGVSSARNAGLKLASGEYIAFVDGDDTVEKNIYSRCMSDFEKNDVDIVVYLSNTMDEYGTINNKQKIVTETLLTRKEAVRELVDGNKFGCACYSKVFTRNSIGNIVFNERLSVNEDFLFVFYCFANASKIFFNGCYLYNYRKHKDSVTAELFNIKKLDSIIASREMYKYCKKENNELVDISLKRFVMTLMSIFNSSLGNKDFEKLRMAIRKKLILMRKEIFTNQELSKVQKTMATVLMINTDCYSIIYKLYKVLVK